MKKNNTNTINFLFTIIVIVYILMLSKILFFKFISPLELFSTNRETLRSLSLVPLDSIRLYMNGRNFASPLAVLNVIGNILIFIPLGTFLMVYSKEKSVVYITVTTLLTSVAVEIIQYIFALGVTDIDDIILNTIGGLTGVFLYQILKIIFKSDKRIKGVIIWIVLISAVLYMVLLAFATYKGYRVKLI